MSDTKYGSRSLYSPFGKIYFIGDVHNEGDKLINLLDQIEPLLTQDDHVVFLGDIINRGNQPALTIETLVDFVKKHPDQVFFVQGNHESMFQHYLTTGKTDWFQYIETTLEGLKESWQLTDILPETIAEALTNKGFREVTSRMIPYYETDKVIGTHAPLDVTIVEMNGGNNYQERYKNRADDPIFVHLLDRMKYDIMWQFTGEDLQVKSIDKFKVCGHQPGRHNKPRIFKDRAFIDTGAGLGPKRPITCLEYPSKKFYQSSS